MTKFISYSDILFPSIQHKKDTETGARRCAKSKNRSAISVPQRYFAYAVLFDVLVYDVTSSRNDGQCNVKLTDSFPDGHRL